MNIINTFLIMFFLFNSLKSSFLENNFIKIFFNDNDVEEYANFSIDKTTPLTLFIDLPITKETTTSTLPSFIDTININKFFSYSNFIQEQYITITIIICFLSVITFGILLYICKLYKYTERNDNILMFEQPII